MKYWKSVTTLVWFSCLVVFAYGQELEKAMFKPFGENTNVCYGNALIPSTYDTIVENIEVKTGYTYIKRTPPTFDTIVERVLVRPGYTRYEVTEPVFETKTLRVTRKAGEDIINEGITSTLKKENVTVEAAPTIKVWRKTKRIADCRSRDPEDCLTWQLVTIPARKVTLQREVLPTLVEAKPFIVRGEEDYIVIEQKILKEPAKIKEVDVLPEYKEVVKYVQRTEATFQQVSVPPVYEAVTKYQLTSEGGTVEPLEVVCPKDYPLYVPKLQEKLATLGYEVGRKDGVLREKTKNALLDYQVKHNLPVGQLDLVSMRHLGVF